MKIYLEYVIIDNLVMDYLLLNLSAKICRLKFNKLRLILGAIIGTIGAILFPLITIDSKYLFLLKIMLGMLICLVAINHQKIGEYIKFFNVFLLSTFILGGSVFAVLYLFGISVQDYAQAKIIPVGLSILIAVIISLITKKIITKTYNGLITQKFKYNCIIKKDFAVLKVEGYFDSGNMLLDEISGLPITLCKQKVINKLVKKGACFPSPREIKIGTALNVGKLKLYPIDCLLIANGNSNQKRYCMLGAVENFAIDDDLLLGAYIF